LSRKVERLIIDTVIFHSLSTYPCFLTGLRPSVHHSGWKKHPFNSPPIGHEGACQRGEEVNWRAVSLFYTPQKGRAVGYTIAKPAAK
jgi:hypothetical protein